MPISHVSKTFAVADCKIAKMTADPSGGTATYATSIDVPGIKSVTITGTVEVKQLRGDNVLLDADSVITEIGVSIEYAKLSLDVLTAMFSATTTDAGTTPNQTATTAFLGNTKPTPFRLQAVSVGADSLNGNVQFSLYKLIAGGLPEMGMAEEDYKTHSLDMTAIPRLSDNKWIDAILNETAVALT